MFHIQYTKLQHAKGDHPTELWMEHNSLKTNGCLCTAFSVLLVVYFFLVQNDYASSNDHALLESHVLSKLAPC